LTSHLLVEALTGSECLDADGLTERKGTDPMSGKNIHHQSTYGPCKLTKLDLMGIRFVENGGDGSGAGGEGGDGSGGDGADDANKGADKTNFTAPASQEELDRIISARLARERATKFGDYDDLKKKAEELDSLKEKSKTADQKAIDAAKDEGRNEVRAVLAAERVSNALAKALAGRIPDAAALLDLDRSQFIKDGTANTELIDAWVQEHSTEVEKQQKKKGDPGQGRQDEGNGSITAGQSAYEARHPRKQ